MKLGIIGVGYVGSVMLLAFSKYHEVFAYDKYKSTNCRSLQEVVERADIIFVCVPTPQQVSGECDLTIVNQVVAEVATYLTPDKVVVIRSTVPPGTTQSLIHKYPQCKFAMNPEFLREKHAYDDFVHADRIIIGADKEAFEKVRQVYVASNFKCPIVRVDPTTAELTKLFNNAFLALKVTFANEMFRIAELFSVNYDTLVECVAMDKRFGGKCDVPGPDGKYGFGGHCLPKDLNNLITSVRSGGYEPYLLAEVQRSNLRFRNDGD